MLPIRRGGDAATLSPPPPRVIVESTPPPPPPTVRAMVGCTGAAWRAAGAARAGPFDEARTGMLPYCCSAWLASVSYRDEAWHVGQSQAVWARPPLTVQPKRSATT